MCTTQGIVEIPLRSAAAADPENLAMRPELGVDCERARQRREGFYFHIINTLRGLVNPSVGGGDSQKGLSQAERNAYKTAILKVC